MMITVSISDTITSALAKLADAAQKTLLTETAGLAVLGMTCRSFQIARPPPGLVARPDVGRVSCPPEGIRNAPAVYRNYQRDGLQCLHNLRSNLCGNPSIRRSQQTEKGRRESRLQRAEKKVFAKSVTIPARPFFPVTSGGNFTEAAKKAISQTVSLKLKSLVKDL